MNIKNKLKTFSDYHLFIVETWPWILFNESLHRWVHFPDNYLIYSYRLVDHSWEMILLNNSFGLANESESSCEGTHKVISEMQNYQQINGFKKEPDF